MKILVTGANGQLGTEMRNLLEKECPGNALYTDIDTLDLTDVKAVEHYVLKNDITHIVNCAAYTAVDKTEEDKYKYISEYNNLVKAFNKLPKIIRK